MKLLCVVSSLDLTQPFSATPAWWQLLKGLYEIGVDVLATTYQGPAIESLWWRALPNPVRREGDLFKALRDAVRRTTGQRAHTIETAAPSESLADRMQRRVAQTVIAPRWRAFMDKTLLAHPDVEAVLFLTIPLNHIVGLATYIRQKFNKPTLYYDGDVPASLPRFAGFSSGFKIYRGADLSEYAAFISNSLGGADMLREMGAPAVHVLYYGADPDVFSPLALEQDIDVFFYGHTREYREAWIDGMIAQASLALPEAKFAVRGRGLGDLGKTQMLPYLSFSKLREYACRSKINLCVTRRAHASVLASSSSRPFELASMGACIVANPYLGVENWFEPDKEIVIIRDADEAVARYRWLLGADSARRAIGTAARERVLKEHTFRQRAQQLVEILKAYR
jgi:glycosyltransferase involved in cell wall biosynthesis